MSALTKREVLSLRHSRNDTAVVSFASKLVRDGQTIKRHARWVLIIDREGHILRVANNEKYVANVIAVLGPVTTEKGIVPEAVLFEIGISRGRPYAQAEAKSHPQRTARALQITRRKPVIHPTHTQFLNIWPTIYPIIEQTIIDVRARWSRKSAYGISKGMRQRREFERGVFFTVAHVDSVLHEAFSQRDVDERNEYFSQKVHFINHFLRTAKCSYYSEKQLKRMTSAQKVAEMWTNMCKSRTWSPRYAKRILAKLPDLRLIQLRLIADSFKLDLADEYVEDEFLQRRARHLKFPAYLRARRVVNAPPKKNGPPHGKECCTFEVFFEKRYREEHNI